MQLEEIESVNRFGTGETLEDESPEVEAGEEETEVEPEPDSRIWNGKRLRLERTGSRLQLCVLSGGEPACFATDGVSDADATALADLLLEAGLLER